MVNNRIKMLENEHSKMVAKIELTKQKAEKIAEVHRFNEDRHRRLMEEEER